MKEPYSDRYTEAVDAWLAARRQRRRWPRLSLRPRLRLLFRSDIREIVEALAWYAEPTNWRVIVESTEIDSGGHTVRTFRDPPVHLDGGGRAREALGIESKVIV